VRDAGLRQALARVWIEGEVLRLIRLRTVSAVVSGRAPGPEASVRKALADDHGQRVMELAQALVGTYGLLADAGPAEGLAHAGAGGTNGTETSADAAPGVTWPASVWAKGYLFSRALTIGGGTAEVQRNIIAERVLGLPHDVDVEGARPWAQSRAPQS
jgi:3-oxochol-4-en-24-oyl-CoA dehydrogenase